jgi:PTH1 family peptidyl-tRNA hydrolase
VLDRLRRRRPDASATEVFGTSDVWVVAGLGNPSADYASTRHNLGHLVVDALLERAGDTLRTHKSRQAQACEVRLGGVPGERTVLMRARDYMNNSGGAVASILSYYKVTPDRLIVVHDELDIPYGELRAKFGGGDGGHNGVRSVRKVLGTGDFYRVRVGIGRPPGRQDPADYVLRPFTAAERRELTVVVQRAADCVESLLADGLATTQSSFNH